METKFPTLLLEVMKTDSHPITEAKKVSAEAIILNTVIGILNNASPQLAKFLKIELKKDECTSDLLVSLVKNNLLHCIEEMINGNDTTLKRLMLFLPDEYLKVNLLWVYNQFVEESSVGFRKILLDEIRPDFD
jgi:hypothetical protein